MNLKAIETRFDGYRFRSRLEARWAVFFKALSVPYEYEKEGFSFDDGLCYLPDFWLPDQKAWFEVKGEAPKEIILQERLAALLSERVFIAWGNIPYPVPETASCFLVKPSAIGHSDFINKVQWGYWWGRHRETGIYDIQYSEKYNYTHFSILEAYNAARSARFEKKEANDES